MSLIELVVSVAVIAIVAGTSYETLAQRPAQARTTAIAFAGLVGEARALAAITADAGAGTGATIGVTREGEFYVATLYAYRPIGGSSKPPVRAPNAAPLRTLTALAIVSGNTRILPPFAVFFSASGHASAQAPFSIDADAALAVEPTCSERSGVLVAFLDGVHDQAYRLSCEFARLDLDTTLSVRSNAAPP